MDLPTWQAGKCPPFEDVCPIEVEGIFQPSPLLLKKNISVNDFCGTVKSWREFFFDKENTTSSLEKKPQILTGFGCVEAHLTFSLQMNKRHSNHCRGSSIGMSLWPFFFCQAKECVGEGVNNAQGTHFRCWLGNVENFLIEMVWFETIGGNRRKNYNTAKALR